MQRYIARRLLLLIPTLLLLALLLFILLRAIPGDLAITLVGEGYTQPEEVAKLRKHLGLDRPLYVQFGRWLWQTVHGDLGYSLFSRRPVVDALRSKAEVTLTLAVIAASISLVWALPLGIVSALWRGSWLDQGIRAITAVGLAIPGFWLGILVLIALVTLFNWTPPMQHAKLFDDPLMSLQRLALPALVIGFRFAAIISRMTRSTMLEVINEDYVRTARAKGLDPSTVIVRHALANAFLPILTIAALLFGGLLEGAVVIEVVFTLPGMGRELLEAVRARDLIMVQGLVMSLGVFMVVWILVIDLLYAYLDPRIRYA